MIEVMLLYTGDFLFGKTLDTYTVEQLVLGWVDPLANRVSDYNSTMASFLRGDAIAYNPYVTPVLTTSSFPST